MRDLVERAARGDQDAFASIATAVVDRCHGIAYRILRDPFQAQDATQQALIGAWRDLPTLRDPARFDAWLYRLVVHACYVQIRSERRHAARVRALAFDRGEAQGPETSVLDRAALEHAFRELTPEQRAVVVSHHYLGYSPNEIAENLGIPVGTVRSRLHYAVRRLRAVLDSDQPHVIGSRERSA